MRWEPANGGVLVADPTPDTLAARNERLAWLMRGGRPFRLVNGVLLDGSRDRIASDLREIMQIGRTEWKGRMRDLELAGAPVAAEGTYGALGAYPIPASLPAVTPSNTGEIGLLTTAQAALYMPIPANGLLAPQAYRYVVAGVATTTATAANYSFTPRIGNAVTSPSLGTSGLQAKTASLTNAFWILKADLTVQQIGTPGLNARAIGHFEFKLNSAVGGAFTSWLWGTGTTAASFDSTVSPGASANGGQMWLGILASAAAADTFTVQQVHFMDWN